MRQMKWFLTLLITFEINFANCLLKPTERYGFMYPGLNHVRDNICKHYRENNKVRGAELIAQILPEEKILFTVEDAKEVFLDLDCGEEETIVSKNEFITFDWKNRLSDPVCEPPEADEEIQRKLLPSDECDKIFTSKSNPKQFLTYCYKNLGFWEKEFWIEIWERRQVVDTVDSLSAGARKLDSILGKDDVVIFLGRSPVLLMKTLELFYELKGSQPEYKMIQLNMSRKPDIFYYYNPNNFFYRPTEFWNNLVTKTRLQIYKEYITEKGLEIGSIKGNLYIVDYAYSGISLVSAAHIFRLLLDVPNDRIHAIVLGQKMSSVAEALEPSKGIKMARYNIADSSLTAYLLEMEIDELLGNIPDPYQLGHPFPTSHWTPTCKNVVANSNTPLFARMTWNEVKQTLIARDEGFHHSVLKCDDQHE